MTFVVDDTPIPACFPEHYATLYADPGVTRVLLRPHDDALMDRLRNRAGLDDEFLLGLGAEVFDEELGKLPTDGWHAIDSTHLTVEETVDEVMHLLARGRGVDPPSDSASVRPTL